MLKFFVGEPSWFKALATLSKNSRLSVIPGVAFCRCGMQTCFVQADVMSQICQSHKQVALPGIISLMAQHLLARMLGDGSLPREALNFPNLEVCQNARPRRLAPRQLCHSRIVSRISTFWIFVCTFSFWMFSSPQSSMLKKYPTFVAWCFHPCLCAWNLKHPFEPRQKPGLTFHEILVV